MGIFSGSGVGKSVLLSMLARNVQADVSTRSTTTAGVVPGSVRTSLP